MKLSRKNIQLYYHLLVAVAGIVLLAASTRNFEFDLGLVGIGLISAAFTAFMLNYPVGPFNTEITLIHMVTLGTGLLYGPALAAWAASAGILTGFIVKRLRSWNGSQPLPVPQVSLSAHLYQIGHQIVPLFLAFSAYNWVGGLFSNPNPIASVLPLFLSMSILFTLVHTAIFLVDYWFQDRFAWPKLGYHLLSLFLIEALPLPYVIVAVLAYPEVGLGSLGAVTTVPAVLSILIFNMVKTRKTLERRLQDLSMLHKISQTMRSTVDLDELLGVIHEKITEILDVRNFYVALYDQGDEQLKYPLAVKHGEHQNWPPRLLDNRLTDRVIMERKPVLLPREAYKELERIGLPSGDEQLTAWLGVPLATPERVLGCLAVFSYSPEVEFTEGDLNLLTTLSGQVSVALENALLYEQAQKRALQLEILNQTSTKVSASLNLQEVLTEFCNSVSRVGGAEHNAVFLLEPDEDKVFLAQARGLSEQFIQANLAFPIAYNGRTKCLRTGRPELFLSLNTKSIEKDYRISLEEEHIQAFGDFPLTTPDGHIGFLTVYFNEEHDFLKDEIELLQTFAAQAALAVSNARLHDRTDQALSRRAQQLSILEAVGRQLSAVISSERLFEMILEYAMDFTNSPWGSFSLYDPEAHTFELKANIGYVLDILRFNETQGIAGRVLRTKQPGIVNDVAQDPDFYDVTNGQTISQLTVPLIREERVLGIIVLESPESNAYTPNDLAFITQLADQAAIAVTNAELYRDSQERLNEQASLYLVSTHLVGNLELDRVLNSVTHAISAALDGYPTGTYLWQEVEKNYSLKISTEKAKTSKHNLQGTLEEGDWVPTPQTLLETGPLQIFPEQGSLSSSIDVCDHCQALVFPLKVSGQKLGLIVSHLPKDYTINPVKLQLPNSIAAQGAIALQNALLFSDVAQGRDRLEAVLNSVGEGVLMVAENGLITLANSPVRVITGFAIDEIVGKRLPDLPPQLLRALGYSDNGGEHLEHLFDQKQTPSPSKYNYKFFDKHLERATSPVWGSDGLPIGWVIVIRDVTEEFKIKQARELITETLVHDLRSPIGAVKTSLELIKEVIPEQDQDELTMQSLDIGQRSTQRVLNLIDSLLDISRLESGVMELELGLVNLHSLVLDVVAEMDPQVKEFGIILKNRIPKDLPQIRVDRNLIQRVLTNLLDNALKFTPEGGLVRLSTQIQPEESITMRVCDSGPGIPDEYRDEIFKRFAQIPGQRGRRRGSGLGLTFCQLTVEAHGGRIWVQPCPAGDGSTFSFTIPLAV